MSQETARKRKKVTKEQILGYLFWILLGVLLLAFFAYRLTNPLVPLLVQKGWAEYLKVPPDSFSSFYLACLNSAPCAEVLFSALPGGFDGLFYAGALWALLGAVLFLRPKTVEIPLRYGQHFATAQEVEPLVERRKPEELVDSGIPSSPNYRGEGLTGYLGLWMGETLEEARKGLPKKRLFLRLPSRIERIHTITYAGTGGGKTVGIFRPRIALDAAEGQIAIIFDTKYPNPGDSYMDVRDWFRAYGRRVWIIDPFGMERGEESVQLPVLKGIDSFEKALDAARLIYPPDIENADAASRVFVANARTLLAGIIYALATSKVEKLSFKRIAYYANQDTQSLVNWFSKYPEAKAAIQSTLGSDKYVLSGAQNRLVTDLEIFELDSADWLFSDGPKAVKPERFFQEPGMIHLVFPERRIRSSAGRAILRFFKRYFDGVILRIVEELGAPLPIHVNYYYDELALFGFLPDLDSDLATLRSRNISVHMATQSRAQMQAIYGERWEATENNNIGTFYLVPGSYTPPEAVYWSKMLGRYSFIGLSMSESVSSDRRSEGVSLGEKERELITADEMLTMGIGEMIVLVRGFHPILVKSFPVESKESPVNWILRRVEAYRAEKRKRLLESQTPPDPPHTGPVSKVGEAYKAFESFLAAYGRAGGSLTFFPREGFLLQADKVKETGLSEEAKAALIRYHFLVETRWGLAIPRKCPYGKKALEALLEAHGVRVEGGGEAVEASS